MASENDAAAPASKRPFPVLKGAVLDSIPWGLIAPHAPQAMKNHSQTLELLAQRGGLSPSEAVMVIRGEAWTAVTRRNPAKDERALYALVRDFYDLLADRAASAPQAVRMLTEEEVEAAWSDATQSWRRYLQSTRGQTITAPNSESWHEAVAIQRKFCEVNGLGIMPLAPQDTGGK